MVGKLRKQNIKALQEREKEEHKALEQTRRLRAMRMEAETNKEIQVKPARKLRKRS